MNEAMSSEFPLFVSFFLAFESENYVKIFLSVTVIAVDSRE